MMVEQPYAGLIVLDMSHGSAEPYRAILLGQHGARVIKIGCQAAVALHRLYHRPGKSCPFKTPP